MKKLGILFSLLFFLAGGYLAAACGDGVEESCCCLNACQEWEIEVRGAGVYAASHRFREIYSPWSPEVQLEMGKRVWDKINAWANVSYLWARGHSKPLHHKTQLSLVPLSFGLKYLFPVTCEMNLYFGAGAAYSFLHVRDHGEGIKRKTSREEWGGVLKSGLQYTVSSHLFLDLFADYLFQRFSRPHSRQNSKSANLGGLRLGAGIGVRF